MTDIFIARHAETEANRAGLWQGAKDSPLTPLGEQQVKLLAARLGDASFDAVVSSNLGRAAATAAGLGYQFAALPSWREPDLGAWEGRTTAEVRAMSPDALAAYARGEDVALGGADRLSDAAQRLLAAYEDLVAAVGPAGRALVVTHGLAITVLTGLLLGARRPNPLALPDNTAIVHLSAGGSGSGAASRLLVHNDATHLADAVPPNHRGTRVVFIRHGQTVGNLEGRWQGQLDGELTDEGRAQAEAAAAALPDLDALYTSRLGRAVETAEIIGASLGLEPIVVAGVEEFGFGEWEGLTSDEIRLADPEAARRLFDEDEDVVRGKTGETWAALKARVGAAARRLSARHEGGTIGIVSHGGATRAFANDVLELTFGARRAITSIRNTAHATFDVSTHGERILNWNIAPHLER